jgi:hypothetical protein
MNMLKWLIRKLPKRVITYEGVEFFPQVWFIWWHYLWTDCGELARAECFQSIGEAVHCMEIRWETDERRVKTVVWRSGEAKKLES